MTCILMYNGHFNPMTGGWSMCWGGRGTHRTTVTARASSLRAAPRLSDHMSPLFGAFVSHLLRQRAAFREARVTSGYRPCGDARIGLFVPFILCGWVCKSLTCLAIRIKPLVRLREKSCINY